MSSFSTACKRVGVKWVTPTIWKVPLQNEISEEAKHDVPKLFHRKLPLELAGELKIMSRYERVFKSLETVGILSKPLKVPGGAVGPS